MLSITLQVNLHTAVHAHRHCVGDAFWSHDQNKGHMFEDDEKKATIVAQSKQSVNISSQSNFQALEGNSVSVIFEVLHINCF